MVKPNSSILESVVSEIEASHSERAKFHGRSKKKRGECDVCSFIEWFGTTPIYRRLVISTLRCIHPICTVFEPDLEKVIALSLSNAFLIGYRFGRCSAMDDMDKEQADENPLFSQPSKRKTPHEAGKE